MISRRHALAGLTAALSGAGVPAFAARRVTMLVGATDGSSADAIARAFAPFLTRALKSVEVGVRNVPGQAGLTALTALADAPASGATIGWVTTPTLPARVVDRGIETLMPRIRLIGAVLREPIAFVSAAATPLVSVQDLIQRAAQDADAIPLGTPPAGSPPHLATLRLQVLAQTRLNIVTFPSAAAARQAVIAGNVSAAALGLSDVIGALRDDKLVGLGIAARSRTGILPNLPVLNEAGVPLSAAIRRGVAVPKDLPEEFVAPLTAALRAIATDSAFKATADAAGYLTTWIDAPTWTAQAEAERQSLTKLWETEPWINASGG